MEIVKNIKNYREFRCLPCPMGTISELILIHSVFKLGQFCRVSDSVRGILQLNMIVPFKCFFCQEVGAKHIHMSPSSCALISVSCFVAKTSTPQKRFVCSVDFCALPPCCCCHPLPLPINAPGAPALVFSTIFVLSHGLL